jgi:hypothetical protein
MKTSRIALVCGALALFAASIASAEEKAPAVHKYVGAEKCKMCHNTAKSCMQYKLWKEMKHANAFATLAGDSAKAIAKAKGIADPQKSEACLKCHVTGYGEPADHFAVAAGQPGALAAADGIQCESCHGPGSDYKSGTTMKGIRAGTMKAADFGLVVPTKATCVKCHNADSPTWTSFDFSADSAKIAHPVPKTPPAEAPAK